VPPHQHRNPPAPPGRGHLRLLDDESAAEEARLRAVVAEDDVGIRRLLAAVLELDGWEVVEAADGAEAVELARTFRPDAVLMDVMMPTKDGLAATRELRTAPDSDGCAVVMVSAKGSEADIQRGLAAGADDYVVKPFDPQDVVARARARAAARRR
jgi:two-component system, OmpR family, response regulator MtrA